MATALVMLALYAAGCVLYRNFFSLRVAVNLFGDNAFLGIAAVGATLVILSGGIDLSVGSVVAFSSIWKYSTIGPFWTVNCRRPLWQTRTTVAMHAVALPVQFARKYPSWSICGNAASDLAPISGRLPPGLTR